ncbi:hypothetical protein AB0873_14890 [Micromonospora sp. NPDC047707]|uniref:hypothetical protein n=1 Tax=Micromonospora sp. NPDC047707 TaxID=3154498 RepID=UPI0034545F66
MRITLDLDDVQLLAAVEQGRVHMDPTLIPADWETVPAEPSPRMRPVGPRLFPLRRAGLVELFDDPDRPPGPATIHPYRLTAHGEAVLAEARQAQAEATVERAASPPVGGAGSRTRTNLRRRPR